MSEKLHSEILTKEQLSLLNFIKRFNKDFYLVGGTAISLYLGHRRSIYFDLFSAKKLNVNYIKNELKKNFKNNYEKIYEAYDQLHYTINGVKLTFFEYNYNINHRRKYKDYITMPSLLDLAAMKASAFGGPGKWKDYVDMYFILKNKYDITQIIARAEKLFSNEFNGKLFIQQLGYFDDISYEEVVEYLIEAPKTEQIKEYLLQKSLEFKFDG